MSAGVTRRTGSRPCPPGSPSPRPVAGAPGAGGGTNVRVRRPPTVGHRLAPAL